MAFHNEQLGRKKARALLARTGHHMGKAGGHIRDHVGEHADRAQDVSMITRAIHEHEENDHPGKRLTRLRLASGGVADGAMAEGRADRAPRGRGGKGAKNHIAIVIAPQGQNSPVPVPVPGMAARPPMPPPPQAMPPRPPMPQSPMGMPPGVMGAPPPGAMPGGMPMRKSGGRSGRTHGEAESMAADMPWSAQRRDEYEPMKLERRQQEIETAEAQRARRASGGQVGSGRVRGMTAGSGSGEGRLQKGRDLDYCVGGRS